MFSQNYARTAEKPDIGAPWLTSLSYIQAAQDPNWSFYLHMHEETLEISYVFAGRGAIYVGGRFYEVREGDIVIKNPRIEHAEKSDCDDPLEQICVNIDGFKLPDAPANTIPQAAATPVIFAGESKVFLDAVFHEMCRQTVDVAAPDLAYVNMLLSAALAAVCHRAGEMSAVTADDTHGKMVEQVRRYIGAHFREPLTLEGIADTFHISVFYLARQFKKFTGFTVGQYITNCRMGEAQRRLVFKDDATGDIAKACGYDNLSYFYTVFKKKVGCTPAAYKRRYSR